MKQHIDEKQILDLPEETVKKLAKKYMDNIHKWIVDEGVGYLYMYYYSMPVFNIGQMIEMLKDKSLDDVMIYNNTITYCGAGGGHTPEGQIHEELCDNLWQVILNELD